MGRFLKVPEIAALVAWIGESGMHFHYRVYLRHIRWACDVLIEQGVGTTALRRQT